MAERSFGSADDSSEEGREGSAHVSEPAKCSRSRSRMVRSHLFEHILPNLSPSPAAKAELSKGFTLERFAEVITAASPPSSCPFLPEFDVFFAHELTKVTSERKNNDKSSTTVSRSSNSVNQECTCGICGKKFKREAYLDRHLHLYHSNGDVNPDENDKVGMSKDSENKNEAKKSVCVSDYYEMFSLGISTSPSFLPPPSPPDSLYDPAPPPPPPGCSDKKMKALNSLCRETLSTCFSSSSSADHDFIENYCGALRCEGLLHGKAGVFFGQAKMFSSPESDFANMGDVSVIWCFVMGIVLVAWFGIISSMDGGAFVRFWEGHRRSDLKRE